MKSKIKKTTKSVFRFLKSPLKTIKKGLAYDKNLLKKTKQCENLVKHEVNNFFRLLVIEPKNKKNIRIIHFGVPQFANAGDGALYLALRNQFEQINNCEYIWTTRDIVGEVTDREVDEINNNFDLILVGGHGLFMVDTNRNDNSGWQWNITLENLNKINKPIAVYGVGYNRFWGQEDFKPVFSRHLEILIEKSCFFGLRNYGSIESVKRYVNKKFHDKIMFQPCPTNTLSTDIKDISKIYPKKDSRKIAICVAFDRVDNRFGDDCDKIIISIIDTANQIINRGYDVEIICHHRKDAVSDQIKKIRETNLKIVDFFDIPDFLLYHYYSCYKVVIGMRGHSLMIPFGLGIPIISISTQDKQKWFMEAAGLSDWEIPVTDMNLTVNLCQIFDEILFDYNNSKKRIFMKQNEFRLVTEKNISVILSSLTI